MMPEDHGSPASGSGRGHRPPAWARLAFWLILPDHQREFFLGDLQEEGAERGGRRLKRSWTREVLGAVALRLSSRSGSSLARPLAPAPPHDRTWSGKGDGIMRDLLADVRFGFRTMARAPGFTAVALVTMALGIGANTAMFSLVNGVVLSPLPFPEADRLVDVRANNLSQGWEGFSVAPLNLWDWEDRNQTLEVLAGYQRSGANYTGGERPLAISTYRVTPEFLGLLGGEPAQGRGILPDDLDPDAEPVVVLSYGFWERAFGGDPAALGSTMVLDDVTHTIVGVLPEGWRAMGRTRADVIVPLVPQPWWYENRGSHFLRSVGRLKEGVTLEQARADLSAVAAGLEAEYPETNQGWGVNVRPLAEVMLGSTSSQLLIFMASVGLILLIACANLANMTLARATVRTRELAIRTAMVAGRGRVARQLLAESVLLATLGGAAGVALAYLGLNAFQAGWPTLLPRMESVGVDLPVLAFSLGISLLSGVLFGLLPALTAAGGNLQESLRKGGRSVAGDGSRSWMRRGLVVAEMGLAVVLLASTGLLLRSFSMLRAEDPGFRTEDRVVFGTPLADARYPDRAMAVGYGQDVMNRIQALPGVEAVAYSSLLPLEGSDELWGYWIVGQESSDGQENGSTLFYRVSPGYFQAMGIPLARGRDLAWTDGPDAPRVAVISRSLADQYFPEGNAVGQRIRFGTDDDDPEVEVVGVAGTVQHYSLGETFSPQVYVPFQQVPSGYLNFVVRSPLPLASLSGGIMEAVEAVDPDQVVMGLQAADDMVAESISMPRFRALLMTGFGAMALLLATVGLYGVLAYSVSRRRKEIGVRMALGASRGSVLGLVLREGLPLVGIGLAVGLIGALGLTRVLQAMLFGVGARDPAVFVGVPLVLVAVATSAMVVPARRASRVDPVRTLGEE